MEQYLSEVESILTKISPVHKSEKWMAKNYVGSGRSKLKFLDIKIPQVRAAFKEGFSFFQIKSKSNNIKECWKIFDYIWKNSEYFEVMLLSSYFAASRPVEEKIKYDSLLLSWLDKSDNWAHSDELSGHYAQMLEFDNSYYELYEKWNRSNNPWKRRQSLVGILLYARFRKKPLSWHKIKPLVDRLLLDEDYYVQKGVGWCLRETFNLYPDVVFQYMQKKAHFIKPAAWTACTEKLSKVQKTKLLKLRKNKA